MGASKVSSDHTFFGDEQNDNGPDIVSDNTVTANANISHWTMNFTDTAIELFAQDSGPSLPENFDVSMANALHYFNLLFKPEIFNDIRDHTNNCAIFKINRNREILTMFVMLLAFYAITKM